MASKELIDQNLTGLSGHINTGLCRAYQLKYANKEARVIFEKIYYNANVPRLERKYKKVYNALVIDKENP